MGVNRRQTNRWRRWLAIFTCVWSSIVWSAATANALVVTTTTLDTTQPPADNPGWNNVTQGGSRNFTYLGNGWALSAWHVGPEAGEPASQQMLTFSTGTFSLIPNQNYILPNPSGSGLSALTDLRLVRLSGDPGLPAVTIASQALTSSNLGQSIADVTYIGQGPTRQPTTSTCCNGAHSGYYGMGDNTKRWGKNQIANDDPVFNENDNDLRGKVSIDFNGDVRDIISMFTLFDQSGIPYEAQAITGDSGSAVFRKNGAQWELIGVVNTLLGYQNQPVDFAAYGSGTSFADLTYYRGEILNIMNGHTNFSVVGDVNLDGVVSGNGAGSWATDDITAFVQGWNWQQAQPNVESWKKGDLNLDGVTNVNDFFLMRTAVANAGLGAGASALSGLFSSGVVPEPSSLALATAAICLAFGRHRPRARRMA